MGIAHNVRMIIFVDGLVLPKMERQRHVTIRMSTSKTLFGLGTYIHDQVIVVAVQLTSHCIAAEKGKYWKWTDGMVWWIIAHVMMLMG